MASAGTRAAAAAVLFFFSVVVFLFLFLLRLRQASPPGLTADLLVSTLERLLDGRGLLELATRRNMILLCHAILLLILRDAGVLGAPASRRSRSPPGEATAAPARPNATRSTAVVALTSCSAAPAQPYTTRSTVVWRRRGPRNRALVAPVHEHDAAGRVVDVECRPAVEAAAATWAAPVLTTGPPAQAAEETAAVATKQMVVVESPRNDDDRFAGVVEPLEHPIPSTAIAADGERDDCDDRRFIAVADDEDTAREQHMAEMEMGMELADDRTFEEFIKSQRRQMRQESLQLVSSGHPFQAKATCY